MDAIRRYTTTVVSDGRNRVVVPVIFNPDEAWGRKAVHRLHGTVNGMGVRATLEPTESGHVFVLGAAWRRGRGIEPGESVEVVLAPEGPQRSDLAQDVAAALEAEPEAGAFFDSLAQFYRNAYLRWIDGTKRRPEVRAERIAEMVELLKSGHKQRPRPE
jgi:hypothetical protein